MTAFQKNDQNEISDFFESKFRKLSVAEAIDLFANIKPNIAELESNFWIWETLEDAVKKDIFNLNAKQLRIINDGLFKYYKGSHDM